MHELSIGGTSIGWFFAVSSVRQWIDHCQTSKVILAVPRYVIDVKSTAADCLAFAGDTPDNSTSGRIPREESLAFRTPFGDVDEAWLNKGPIVEEPCELGETAQLSRVGGFLVDGHKAT